MAVQMTSSSINNTTPQEWTKKHLEKYRITYIDMLPQFQKHVSPRSLFLQTDPMHLSQKGHRVVADILEKELISL